MTLFVRAPNPIWFMNNLTGAPLDDTYWAFFLTNEIPYLPQAVYQDFSGTIPWSNPIEFQPSGGLPNNLYFDPTLTYRIEVRNGPLNSDALIWLIENFQAGNTDNNQALSLLTSENLVTNPQFADVSFTSPLTISIAGTYDIAPGWQLLLVGTGTTTINQQTIPGNNDNVGNPPYYLEITSSGWSEVKLFQRFNNNGAIFSGGAIAVAFTAFVNPDQQTVAVIYAPSTSGTSPLIFDGAIQVGSFASYTGAINLDASSNSDDGTDAYVDIIFDLPVTGTINITNIQITGQSIALPDDFVGLTDAPLFQEITYERVVDHEFHVYKNSLVNPSRDTLLVGWDFALNPWQFTNPAIASSANKCYYTADQTIYYQQSNSANNVGQTESDFNKSFAVTANSTSNNKFAIIQYIDSESISECWGRSLSSMVRAYFSTTNPAHQMRMKMRLIWQDPLPATISAVEPILSWGGAGTDPVFTADWTVILPEDDTPITLNNNFSRPVFNDYAFDNFVLPSAASGQSPTLGIVLYSFDEMTNASSESVIINQVSLVNNKYAAIGNPKTFDQVLKECQYYYEKSYPQGILPTTNSTENVLSVFQQTRTGGVDIVDATPFGFNYNSIKRAIPTVHLYAPTAGTIDAVTAILWRGVFASPVQADALMTLFPTFTVGTKATSFGVDANATGLVSAVSTGNPATGQLIFNYTVDARLGI